MMDECHRFNGNPVCIFYINAYEINTHHWNHLLTVEEFLLEPPQGREEYRRQHWEQEFDGSLLKKIDYLKTRNTGKNRLVHPPERKLVFHAFPVWCGIMETPTNLHRDALTVELCTDDNVIDIRNTFLCELDKEPIYRHRHSGSMHLWLSNKEGDTYTPCETWYWSPTFRPAGNIERMALETIERRLRWNRRRWIEEVRERIRLREFLATPEGQAAQREMEIEYPSDDDDCELFSDADEN